MPYRYYLIVGFDMSLACGFVADGDRTSFSVVPEDPFAGFRAAPAFSDFTKASPATLFRVRPSPPLGSRGQDVPGFSLV